MYPIPSVAIPAVPFVPTQALAALNQTIGKPSTSSGLQPLQHAQFYRQHFAENRQNYEFAFDEKEKFQKTFGYALLSKETSSELVDIMQGQPVLEVGAGSGYMSACLRSLGADIKASDPGGWDESWARIWQRDIQKNAEDIDLSEYSIVMAMWPTEGCDWMYALLDKMTVGQMLIYEGEREGGCTGYGDVFDNPEWMPVSYLDRKLNRHHVPFPNLMDEWHVFEKI